MYATPGQPFHGPGGDLGGIGQSDRSAEVVGVDIKQLRRRGAGHVHDTHGQIRARVARAQQPDVLLGDNARGPVELGDDVAAAVLNRVHGAVVPKARAKKDAPLFVTTREASCSRLL